VRTSNFMVSFLLVQIIEVITVKFYGPTFQVDYCIKFNYYKMFELSYTLHFYTIINLYIELPLQHFHTTNIMHTEAIIQVPLQRRSRLLLLFITLPWPRPSNIGPVINVKLQINLTFY
jgi:hypothetical protein